MPAAFFLESAMTFDRTNEGELSDIDTNHTGTILVPEAWVKVDALTALKAEGFDPKIIVPCVVSFAFRALGLTLNHPRDETLKRAVSIVYGDKPVKVRAAQMAADPSAKARGPIFLALVFPLIVPKETLVEILEAEDEKKGEKEEEKARRARAFDAYRGIFELLAQISGFRVTFHADGSGVRLPFLPGYKEIHIFTNASPPGIQKEHEVTFVFGLPIKASREKIRAQAATPGRGQVLKDDDGRSVVQVLPDNWFLLFPTLGDFHGLESVAIMERTLALAWEAAQTKPPESLAATAEAFSAGLRKLQEDWPKAMREYNVEDEARILEYYKAIAQLEQGIKHRETLAKAIEAGENAIMSAEAAARELEQIQQHPAVNAVALDAEGLNVMTKDLFLEHEGTRYRLGPFVIRLDFSGEFGLWSEDPLGPSGRAHPHMEVEGDACFGNAKRAITKSYAEGRFADTTDYVIRWLTDGYEPDNARVSITEWPREKENEHE